MSSSMPAISTTHISTSGNSFEKHGAVPLIAWARLALRKGKPRGLHKAFSLPALIWNLALPVEHGQV